MRDDTGFTAALQFDYYQEQWKLFLLRFRILCLTTQPDSPQMWAYYGDDSTYNGQSVGHWEGRTLVIESTGVRDDTYIELGMSHSEQMRVIERLTQTKPDTLEHDVTVNDGAWYAIDNRVKDRSQELTWRCGLRQLRI